MSLDYLFLDGASGLWSIDEATGVASNVKTLATGANEALTESAGVVYFGAHATGSAAGSVTQLWRTDGTSTGTSLVATLPESGLSGLSGPNVPSFGIVSLVALTPGLVAFEYVGTSRSTLYISDGTSAGTALVSSYTGTGLAALGDTISGVLNNKFLFLDGGSGLWAVDVATRIATNVAAAAPGFSINLVVSGNAAYFAAHAAGAPIGSNTQLWRTDGTASGTTLLTTLPAVGGGGGIVGMVALSTGGVALEYDMNGTPAFYVADGNLNGTLPIRSYTSSLTEGLGSGFSAELNGKLFFLDGGSSGLWSIDEATRVATNIASATFSTDAGLVVSGGVLYFSAHASGAPTGSATELWQSDGTSNGTRLVATLSSTAVGQGIVGLTALANGGVVFEYIANGTNTAYISNGTQVGTKPVTGYASNGNVGFGIGFAADITVPSAGGGLPGPAAPVILSAAPDTGIAGDGITSATVLTLTGTAAANSTVAVLDGSTTLGSATANGSGSWSFVTAILATGAHSFTAKATDAAGNTGVASAATTVAIDTVAPAAPVILSIAPDTGVVGDGITSATVLTLTGTAEANSTVAVLDGSTTLGDVSANSLGSWSFVTATLAAGAHSFTAKATDVAGNTGLASAAMVETIVIVPSNYLWRAGSGLFGTAADWQNTTTGANPATSAPGINDTASWSGAVGTVTGTGSVAQLTVNAGTPSGLVLAGQLTTVSALFAGSATIGSGGTLTVTGNRLSVAGTTSAPANLTVNSGASILDTAAADTSTFYLAIGADAGSAGSVTVTGPNASIDVGANATTIGRFGTGSLSISGGATVRSATANSAANVALSVGSRVGGSGILTITGAGSSYTASGSAFVGRAGSGTLVIDQGGSFTGGSAATASVSSLGVTIGSGTTTTGTTVVFGGSGAATVTNGSVLHSLGDIDVGYDGVTGTMVVGTGSTVTADGRILIALGPDRTGGNGSVTISGGSTVRAGTTFATGFSNIGIGAGAGNNGTVNVTGPGSLLDGNGGRISVGSNSGTLTGPGTGALTVSNGGTVLAGSNYSDTEAALGVGAYQNETGTISISGAGSKLVATGQAVIGGRNTGSGLTAGGTGTVSVATGGLFRATSLALFAGSALTVDATSIGVIGTTAGTAGLLTVDAAATVSGAGAVHAKLLNNGSVIAQGGILAIDQIDAASTGTIGASGGELDVASFGGTSLSFSGTSSIIRLGAETATSVTVTGFGGFDVLDFQNQTSLSLSGTTVTLAGGKTFSITGLASNSKLALGSDGKGGTALTNITATTLVQTANQYALNGSGGTGPILKYNGSAVTVGQFGAGIAPVGAVQISTGYQVAFSLGSNQFTLWNTDASGNYTGSATGVLSGNSLALQLLETTFGADLNNDATIGAKLTTIVTNGTTTLVQAANQYALNGSTGTGPTLQYNGSAVTVGQFGTGVAPVGAWKTSSGYQVAFGLGGNQFVVWNTDASGNYTGGATGVVSGSSAGFAAIEASFVEDLNGDGILNLSSVTTPQTINLGTNSASVSAGLNKPALTFLGLPQTITLGSGGSTINYALQASSGIEEISNFALGHDVLNINLLGVLSSTLQAYDTKVGTANAISLTSTTDVSHGIVLLNTGSVTAGILQSHITFTGGHAIIT